AIMQNGEGGGSITITREAFERIGGMDESFVGWGGEDNEFWERAQTLKSWTWGNLPLVHLWHPSQSGKHDANRATAERYRHLAQVEPLERIRRLNGVSRGEDAGPTGFPNGWATRDAGAIQSAGTRYECRDVELR
ncbi:MAG: galactosyltransferase-related protein, partial [Ramlibacter sp.]